MLALNQLNGFSAGRPAALAPETSDYANPGGTGDRTALITISSDFSPGAGTLNNLIDGGFGANSTDAIQWTNSQLKYILFDFGVGVHKEISEFKWYQNIGTSQGTWWFQGSNDLLQWDLLLEFTIGGTPGTFTPTLLGGYRYYRLVCRFGTLNATIWNEEIEFKIRNVAATIFDTHTANYDYKGGRGPRTDGTELTTTTTLATSAGNVVNIVNGHLPNSGSDTGVGWRITTSQTPPKEIRWQFPSAVIMTEWKWNQATNLSDGTWQLEGSNDASAWTALGSTFALSGGAVGTFVTQTEPSANTTAYLYYRIKSTSGNTSAVLGCFGEFEFKLHD